MADLLTIADLDVAYSGRPAVRGVSLTLRRGEILGLVGESGSGKTSLCSAITGVLPAGASVRAAGLRFDGRELTELSHEEMRRLRASRIGLVPQRPMTSLSPSSPVLRQLRWYHDGPDLADLLGQVGLRAVIDRPRDHPHRFSGGQLQRLLIVLAALARKPDLLIADEPTTTLDATVQAQVLRLLLDLRDRLGLAMLYVTHDLAVVAQICDRVGVMYAGRLVESGTVDQIFTAPRHPYTRALLAALPGRTEPGRRLGTIPGDARARSAGCAFAPRCPDAFARCGEEEPMPITIGADVVRCHRAEEDA
ncbi:ABC transporter ATP-binding protein [Microtetraspora sp. NBRC 16547]|uniref:ABC transporter ATP-binding protein n=1 Tax=Microtetraspora sp. NBRC 16547 TaxID=3030993 RepID=UPI0024A5026E|nr:ABC transporter ATP-binding protein [Microtetraspora sp. NBRC 16547]GLX02561.1 ABC transporter ATP-binding protein [Microtetraspora sp. NBRC 16547]